MGINRDLIDLVPRQWETTPKTLITEPVDTAKEPAEVRITEQPLPLLKGLPVTFMVARATALVSDTTLDMNNWNAVQVTVYVTGTTPSGVVTILGSDNEGGTYVALPDPNATQTVTATRSFSCQVGTRWLKVELSGVSGTTPFFTIVGTPFVAAGAAAESSVAAAAADVHAPAANTAAIVTYAAVAGVKHVITGIAWSYVGGIPTGGNLLVEDVAGTTVFTLDIDESGAGIIVFPKAKKGAAVNTAMIITLAAGGAGVTGKVSILNHWREA